MNKAQHSSLGGEAVQKAKLFLSGEGSATAFTKGTAAFDARQTDVEDYSIGHANGEINIQGTNSAFGGKITGEGEISSKTWFNANAGINPLDIVALSEQREWLKFHADRGISFAGDSNVVGSLTNGDELGETSWQGNGAWLPHAWDQVVVDSESTSEMNGMARALNVLDTANSEMLVNPQAKIYNVGGKTVANVKIEATADASRHMTGSKIKAQAEGFIPLATWVTSAEEKQFNNFATVSGSQGPTADGLPQDLQGFGVGAWILHPFNNPVSASVKFSQEADITKAKQLKNTFTLDIKGMPYTGYTDDAVGAFGGVKDQFSRVVLDDNGKKIGQLTPADITAIDWIEGGSHVAFHNRYFPLNMEITVKNDAVSRQLKLESELESKAVAA